MAGQRAEPFTAETAAAKGAAGGKKSGEVRRAKKALREWAEELLNTPVTDEKMLKRYRDMGVAISVTPKGAEKAKIKTSGKQQDVTHGMLVTLSMIKLAEAGKGKEAVSAYNALAAVTAGGEDHVSSGMTGVVMLPPVDAAEEPAQAARDESGDGAKPGDVSVTPGEE